MIVAGTITTPVSAKNVPSDSYAQFFEKSENFFVIIANEGEIRMRFLFRPSDAIISSEAKI